MHLMLFKFSKATSTWQGCSQQLKKVFSFAFFDSVTFAQQRLQKISFYISVKTTKNTVLHMLPLGCNVKYSLNDYILF